MAYTHGGTQCQEVFPANTLFKLRTHVKLVIAHAHSVCLHQRVHVRSARTGHRAFQITPQIAYVRAYRQLFHHLPARAEEHLVQTAAAAIGLGHRTVRIAKVADG